MFFFFFFKENSHPRKPPLHPTDMPTQTKQRQKKQKQKQRQDKTTHLPKKSIMQNTDVKQTKNQPFNLRDTVSQSSPTNNNNNSNNNQKQKTKQNKTKKTNKQTHSVELQ